MDISIVDLNAQYALIKDEIDRAVSGVLSSGIFITDKHVRQFEEHFALYNGCEYAVGVANGTDALIIGLKALGIGKGDEVITTPFTFFATAEAIVRAGARPVFADIDPFTCNINPYDIEGKISSRTRCILPVHIFGNPADMDKIMEVARKHRLYVLEDACQAVGAEYRGRKAGTIGDIGCFSFFPSKNLGCYGDGGMLVTDSEEIALKSRALRNHGSGSDGISAYNLINRCEEKGEADKYHNYLIGYNSRLDEIQAAVLDAKLRYLDEWNMLRRQKAFYYNRQLKGCKLEYTVETDGAEAVYHIYTVKSERRDSVVHLLKQKGIDSRVYYPVPLHLQKGLEYIGYRKGDFKHTESITRCVFSLPMYPELDREAQDYIIKNVRDVLE